MPRLFYPHKSRPWYPMNRRIAGSQNLSPRIGEENRQTILEIEPRSLSFRARILVTRLSRIPIQEGTFNKERHCLKNGQYSFLCSVQICCRAHPASYLMGTGAHPPGLKWLGRGTNHSPPFSAELNEQSCNSTPFRCLYGEYMRSFFIIRGNTNISREPFPVRNSNHTFRMRVCSVIAVLAVCAEAVITDSSCADWEISLGF